MNALLFDNHLINTTVANLAGNIILTPVNYVDIKGELWMNGVNISSTFVSNTTFTAELKKKVTAVSGKQLSTEDETT
ncbi:MAG: hypothetical protein LBF17_02000 [Mediterranea sp.]|nr:hypothetical protein [Mediterranea sp.]